MSFIELLRRAKTLLHKERRLSLRALQCELDLDDDDLSRERGKPVWEQRVEISQRFPHN